MTAASRRTWWQVAIAAIVLLAAAAIVIVGATTFVIYRHIRTETVPPEAAEARVAKARARFGAGQPLVRIDATGEAVITGRPDVATASATVATLRAVAYDPGARKLVDVSIPFWLLRLSPNGRISFDADSGIDFDAERLHLNVSALEALGPGLVLDHTDAAGKKVLVWTE